MEKKFGLIGKSLVHSYSKKLYDSMFTEGSYELINTDVLSKELLLEYNGLNVTIPYKKDVIQYLDNIDQDAKEMNSVNCITNDNGILTGHNTDIIGIDKTIGRFIDSIKFVLILGNGGVSNTLQYYFKKHHIEYKVVGRKDSKSFHDLSYEDLFETDIMSQADLIINCTPVGTYPNIDDKLDIPYCKIGPYAIIFDLIYNPEETSFMKECKKHTDGPIINGSNMLKEQALASYKLWKIL